MEYCKLWLVHLAIKHTIFIRCMLPVPWHYWLSACGSERSSAISQHQRYDGHPELKWRTTQSSCLWLIKLVSHTLWGLESRISSVFGSSFNKWFLWILALLGEDPVLWFYTDTHQVSGSTYLLWIMILMVIHWFDICVPQLWVWILCMHILYYVHVHLHPYAHAFHNRTLWYYLEQKY